MLVSGFVLSSFRTRAASAALFSSRSSSSSYSTYDPVASSGPSWNGQRWEGQEPTFQQDFDRNRMQQQQQQQQQRPEGRPYFPQQQQQRRQEGRPYFPQTIQQQPAAPMVRYSALSEPEKASLSNANGYYGRPGSYSEYRDSLGTSMMSPPEEREPVMELPVHSKDIQGGSRGTWSSDGRANHDQVQVTMTTDGRPLNADVEVYQGPDNTPQRMRVYSEDGRRRPFTTRIQTPQGAAKTTSLFFNPYSLRDSSSSAAATSMAMAGGVSHSISIINRGPMEFPIAAGVEGKGTTDPEERAAKMADFSGRSKLHGRNEEIHGGHLKTYPFDPSVASVEVRVQSQGLPIMAVVELWQGPGDVKTVAQIYCDDGQAKPFSAIIPTPGTGNTIAIRNVGPTAYPIEAILEVYSVDNAAYSYSYPGAAAAAAAAATAREEMPFYGRY